MAFTPDDVTSALTKLRSVELSDAEAEALTALVADGDEVSGYALGELRTGWIDVLSARSTGWKVEEGEKLQRPGTGFITYGDPIGT